MAKAILYIKPGCPWCNEAIHYFQRKKFPIELRDVLGSPEDFRRLREISGQDKTPTLEQDGIVIADFDINEFEAEARKHAKLKDSLGL